MDESSKGVLRKIYLSSQLGSCIDLKAYLKGLKLGESDGKVEFREPFVLKEWDSSGHLVTRMVVVSNVLGDRSVLLQSIIKAEKNQGRCKVLFPKLESSNGYSVDSRNIARLYPISEYKTTWYLTLTKDGL